MTQNEGLEVLSQNRIVLSELLRPERERERETKQRKKSLEKSNTPKPQLVQTTEGR